MDYYEAGFNEKAATRTFPGESLARCPYNRTTPSALAATLIAQPYGLLALHFFAS
jgi:hypothetical protein